MPSWVTGFHEANGIRIHYLRTGGDKPPLVLLHGLTGNGACWTPLARSLESEYDVVMLDASSRVRVEVIADAGHGVQYDQPERFEGVVRGFLVEVRRAV
jgi:N-formylmaleamate deformylase